MTEFESPFALPFEPRSQDALTGARAAYVSRAKRIALRAALFAAIWITGCGRIGVYLRPYDDVGPRDASVRPDAADGDSGLDAGAAYAGCRDVCQADHGIIDCSSGSCTLSCMNGYADCDAVPDNGCEVSIGDGVDSCGGCMQACSNDHGSTGCSQGLCTPSCAQDYGDCDADPINGCEASLTGLDNCGVCGVACVNPHGTTDCVQGGCRPSCEAGYDDCDGRPENGCETRVESDPMHCGSCDNTCDSSTEMCEAGVCRPSVCSAGRGECNGDSSDGCETDLTSSTEHCGFCGNACSVADGTGACADGVCTVSSCAANHDDCDGAYDNGCETDLETSIGHCGSCSVACTNAHGTTSCMASTCSPMCSSGYGDCDGDPVDGCETALDTASDCGMCGKSCPANGGTPICDAGVCNTLCDLNGTYALKLTVATTWSGNTVLSSGSGTFVFWSALQLTQSGNALSGTLTPCGEVVPDLASVLPEKYRVTAPGTIFDGDPAPAATSISATLSGESPGASFALAPAAWLLGASLADPVNDPWPSRSALSQVDVDADGKVAATYLYMSGGGYSNVPVNAFATARASRGYLASRVVFNLNGSLSSCTQSSGAASVATIDAHTLGCQLTTGSDCNSTQTAYLDDNQPDWQPGSSSYALVKLAAGAACAEVRAALP